MRPKALRPLVQDPSEIKIALVGKVPQDDHPFSWSAILNGYNPQEANQCPNLVIRNYLASQPKDAFGIPGVRVTHIWCDDPEDALRVARFSSIPIVVPRAEDVIGAVDAILIPTDKGEEHLSRVRPFIEANIPIFIDKPLTIDSDHLRQFASWADQDKHWMSSSCMRYAREFTECRKQLARVGELRIVTVTTCRSWERYGIHAMEAAYLFGEPGRWLSVTNHGSEKASIVQIRHESGLNVVIPVVEDMDGSFAHLSVYGTQGALMAHFQDSFFAFKAQLTAFVDYLRNGRPAYPHAETIELMKVIIAGIRSRSKGGRTVELSEVRFDSPLEGVRRV